MVTKWSQNITKTINKMHHHIRPTNEVAPDVGGSEKHTKREGGWVYPTIKGVLL